MSCTRSKNDCVGNSLQLYLREIKDESLLTAEEECTLAEAIARGDSDARTRMIRANLRLVVKIARDYVGRGLVLEDLIGEGNLGLIRATEEFEPRFGTRFSTYASYWIKQSIRHALINTTSTIRLPAHMVGLLTKWKRAERSIYREQGRAASFGEVAGALGLREAQKSLLAKACQARALKLQSGLSAENSRWSPEESRDHREPPEALLEAAEERHALLSRMERLDHRERTILALRYGLEGELPLTLKEIGRRLGVTREWVRKIELRAVRKLDDEQEEQGIPGARSCALARSDKRSRSGSSPALVSAPSACPKSKTKPGETFSERQILPRDRRTDPSPRAHPQTL